MQAWRALVGSYAVLVCMYVRMYACHSFTIEIYRCTCKDSLHLLVCVESGKIPQLCTYSVSTHAEEMAKY